MALPDTKVATSLMKDLEVAIENANVKQHAFDTASISLKTAQTDLNFALGKVEELKNKLFNHLGTSDRIRQSA